MKPDLGQIVLRLRSVLATLDTRCISVKRQGKDTLFLFYSLLCNLLIGEKEDGHDNCGIRPMNGEMQVPHTVF